MDAESERVRRQLRLPAPGESAALLAVGIDAWQHATGRDLHESTKGPWWFEIDGQCWQAGGKSMRYAQARERAVARAQILGASRVAVLPPPD